MIPKDENAKQFAIMAYSPFSHFAKDGSQFPYLGALNENDTIESIMKRFYESAFAQGVRSGKRQKELEIQKVLGITENDD